MNAAADGKGLENAGPACGPKGAPQDGVASGRDAAMVEAGQRGRFVGQNMNESGGQRSVTVLVVEDNPDDVVLLRTAAEVVCPEMRLVFQKSGEEALAYLAPGNEGAALPDLAVVDVRLRGMSGLEFIRQVRGTYRLRKLKVVGWSDGAEPGLGRQVMQAGANAFMRKLVPFDDVLESVRWTAAAARGWWNQDSR